MPYRWRLVSFYQATLLSKDAEPFLESMNAMSQPITPGISLHAFNIITKPENTLHEHSLVLGGGLGELEVDVAAGEAAVDLGVGVEAVVDATALLLVEDDLEELAAVLLGADALADNLNGVGEVSEDGVVDGSESARTGALLLLGVAGAGRALGAGQDAARGEDQDVAVGELLLELTGQAGVN